MVLYFFPTVTNISDMLPKGCIFMLPSYVNDDLFSIFSIKMSVK